MKKFATYTPVAIIAIFAVTILFVFSCTGNTDATFIDAYDVLKLLIIHINDFHGNLDPYVDKTLAPPPQKVGGAAFIATKIKELRKNHEATLLLDGGDIAMGTPLSNEFKGKPVIEYMNLLHFDAMVVGNHEFDWGISGLKNIIRMAKFPVLSANIVDEKTGETPPYLKPYVIFDIKETKIGLIGLTSPLTPTMSNPNCTKGLKFLQPEETVRHYKEILHSKGVSIVGVLSHIGVIKDRELARKVPGISFIIGGHSHIALKDPENVNGTIIVQAGAYGMYLGALHLTIDKKTGKVLSYTSRNELIPISDKKIQADKEVDRLLNPYRAKIACIMGEIIGQAKEEISKNPPHRRGDSPIGALVTDILRKKSKTEIFFYNAGGLRASILDGKITRGDVYRVLPFNDYIVTMDLTGKEILEILRVGVQPEKVIQVSGISFQYDRENNLVSEVRVGNAPINPEKTYKIGTIDYLYNGGDGLVTFKKGRNFHKGNRLARDILCEGIKELGTISIPTDARIIIIGKI